MSAPHFYRGLDKDDRLRVELTTRELAERLVDMNYGVHRLLSHLVDVRRERLADKIAVYRARGDHDIAKNVEHEGDPLADGILALLARGLT
jgi:hypothetical protein